MLFDKVLQRFVDRSPATVMMRGVMEYAFPPERLDELFREHARKQYEDELLFSSVVNVLALAVTGNRRSVHAAYESCKEELGVSVAALYDKFQGTETQVSQALVRESAARLHPLVKQMKGQLPALLPGYRVLILDGNHLAATERLFAETRRLHSVPLPGQCLVLLDPRTRLMLDVFPCEDAHAQERSLLGDVVAVLCADDLIVADRNFCAGQFVREIQERRAYFLIRQHASTLPRKRLIGKRVKVGKTESGVVYEQTLEIRFSKTLGEQVMRLRRITLVLHEPTRDGEREIHLVTNVEGVAAVRLVELYRRRWTIENAFQELDQALRSEINTLCYPKAALLAFCVAVATYNALSVIKAAIRVAHRDPALVEELSGYYLAEEIAATYGGMMIAVPPERWTRTFAHLALDEIATALVDIARQVDVKRFRKRKRAAKQPQPARTGGYPDKHVSTARLIAQRKHPKNRVMTA
jgi:IS4 transposase